MTNIDMTVGEFRRIDARDRAWRTLAQGVLVDVLIAVGLLFYTAFDEVDGWGGLQWKVLSFTITKSIIMTVVSYVMRLTKEPALSPAPVGDGRVEVGEGDPDGVG